MIARPSEIYEIDLTEDAVSYMVWARIPKRSGSSSRLLDWLNGERVEGASMDVLASLHGERFSTPRRRTSCKQDRQAEIEERCLVEEILSTVYSCPAV